MNFGALLRAAFILLTFTAANTVYALLWGLLVVRVLFPLAFESYADAVVMWLLAAILVQLGRKR